MLYTYSSLLYSNGKFREHEITILVRIENREEKGRPVVSDE